MVAFVQVEAQAPLVWPPGGSMDGRMQSSQLPGSYPQNGLASGAPASQRNLQLVGTPLRPLLHNKQLFCVSGITSTSHIEKWLFIIL